MNILVTGGLGYIGKNIVVELIKNGYSVVIIDNCSNSDESVVHQISRLSGKKFVFINADMTELLLTNTLEQYNINIVFHLAGFKSVTESIKHPDVYYSNNLLSTVYLLNAMEKSSCRHIIYSSSASVYGVPEYLPLTEEHITNPIHPYGMSKLICENMITQRAKVYGWNVVSLRYFNPIGCSYFGDTPNTANNLIPIIKEVLSQKRSHLSIYGNCKRDYIHIKDLCSAHICAMKYVFSNDNVQEVFNIGCGKSYSVLHIVNMVNCCGKTLKYKLEDKREGDVPILYTDNTKAKIVLGWEPKYTVEEAIKSEINTVS